MVLSFYSTPQKMAENVFTLHSHFITHNTSHYSLYVFAKKDLLTYIIYLHRYNCWCICFLHCHNTCDLLKNLEKYLWKMWMLLWNWFQPSLRGRWDCCCHRGRCWDRKKRRWQGLRRHYWLRFLPSEL